jgi:class 3 adenylate cyclase
MAHEREASIRLERTLRAPAWLVWSLLADTNRWDRALGFAVATYHWRTASDGRRERIGTAHQFGRKVEWVEPPYQWVEGAFIEGSRHFTQGPLVRGGFRADVHALDAGRTRVELRVFYAGSPALVTFLSAALGGRIRRAMGVFLDGVERMRAGEAPELSASDEPLMRAAHLALMHTQDSTLRGPRGPHDDRELGLRAAALTRDPGLDEAAWRHLLDWIRTAPDEDVEAMRPYELARAWSASRDDVLRVFLHATRAGLVDLRWLLLCPVCRVGAETAGSLREVGRKVRCDACGESYDLDFSDHVEAVFTTNPAVRRVEAKVYCASSAWFRQHVVAELTLAAGETRRVQTRLPRVSLVVRREGQSETVPLPDGDPVPSRVTVQVDEGVVPVVTDENAPDASETELGLVNRSAAPRVVRIERTTTPTDALRGSALLLFPDYLDLFATDAPARGVELSVGLTAVLFSDLTGSTALYERIGDARAFSVVEEHFREMSRVVEAHRGTVVKTMGDAVMATFARLPDAVRAAIEMDRVTARQHGHHGVSLKLGVHAGPCLAVRANDRLDFFGTTVNVAARLQARAEGHELVVLEKTLGHPEAAALVRGFARRNFTATLKGIRETQHLVALAIPAEE